MKPALLQLHSEWYRKITSEDAFKTRRLIVLFTSLPERDVVSAELGDEWILYGWNTATWDVTRVVQHGGGVILRIIVPPDTPLVGWSRNSVLLPHGSVLEFRSSRVCAWQSPVDAISTKSKNLRVLTFVWRRLENVLLETIMSNQEYMALADEHRKDAVGVRDVHGSWKEVKGDRAREAKQPNPLPSTCSSSSSSDLWMGVGTLKFDSRVDSLFHGSWREFDPPFLPDRPGNSFSLWPTIPHHWSVKTTGSGYLYEYKLLPEVEHMYGGIPNMLLLCGAGNQSYWVRSQETRKVIGTEDYDLVDSTCVAPVPFDEEQGKYNGWFSPSYEDQVFLCGAAVPKLLRPYRIYATGCVGGECSRATRALKLLVQFPDTVGKSMGGAQKMCPPDTPLHEGPRHGVFYLQNGKKRYCLMEVWRPFEDAPVVPVMVVSPETCMVRRASVHDSKTGQRWFAYPGPADHPMAVQNYCASKRFVSIYTGPEEHYRVRKPLQLLVVPYLALEDFDAIDAKLGLVLTESLFPLTKTIAERQAMLELLVTTDVDAYAKEDRKKAVVWIAEREKTVILSERNPDYEFGNFICRLGFQGWVRRAKFAHASPRHSSDEIFVCNIHELVKHGIVEFDPHCDKCVMPE